MNLVNSQPDGSFGMFFGHPQRGDKSKQMVERLLDEFGFDFAKIKSILNPIVTNNGGKVTTLQEPIKLAFTNSKPAWKSQPYYPESKYKADVGFNLGNRWIMVEVELSDIRRGVSFNYMSTIFVTGYMRLGIIIVPESISPEKHKTFYSKLVTRCNFHSPNFPLWVIGFEYP
jgi:hypothetical protein